MNATSQFSGQTWVHRDDTVAVGDLTPVSCYVVSATDPTPTTAEACGHIWTGYVEVAGRDAAGMRVTGPVLNHARTTVIDDAPVCVRTLHHYQTA